ncbi:unnamed protein product [Effrenium voratum]|uniref:Ion transport domain-containing protein n=1 Tax=Effrenium voratum TaxID=2562239 RepID=A0AA36IL22_9DINO|nr:unnamed protein product [Effrenium voratum]CAJ1416869.1 unnamed protein product [Effrenium voratum]
MDQFHQHLVALTAEYERLAAENAQLRSEPLFQLRSQAFGKDLPEAPVAPVTPVKPFHAFELPAVPEEVHPQSQKIPSPEPKDKLERKAQAARGLDEEASTEETSTFLLLLDMVPALVILLSAAVAGLSADIAPEHEVWKIFEIMFTVFFIGEAVVKVKVFGWKEYACGADWYWSWFDILCILLALFDMGVTYLGPLTSEDGAGADTGAMGSLKMLKLARLGRIIRLLKFKIFQELKLMIQGVFTGLRVLFWAVVLLVSCMYLLGVVTRTLFSQHEEFGSVPAAMFTSFRCFTDGCAAFDGTPLQERLRKDFGGVFMFAYILLFLFVTIGIFNLIMAVFIDNVADGSTKKRQRQLGQTAPKTEWTIASTLRHIILCDVLRKEAEEQKEGGRRVSKLLNEQLMSLQEMYGYRPHTTAEYAQLTDEIRQQMSEKNIVVTKDEFNHWLATEKDLIDKLDESEIDMSCKSDLFDVLDADLSGELEFEEMVDGLLKCRGPASKTDIIAVRLKTALLVRMLNKVCEKLGIDDP